MSCLYILDINPLSHKWFANIFSQFIGCFFILLTVCFIVQKLFSLMWSHLFIFAFVVCALGVISENSLPRSMSRSFSPMFSARSLMVSGLTFKPFKNI